MDHLTGLDKERINIRPPKLHFIRQTTYTMDGIGRTTGGFDTHCGNHYRETLPSFHLHVLPLSHSAMVLYDLKTKTTAQVW